MADEADVWVLLGHRTGDNNQLLRLAGELGLPFRSIVLNYNALRSIPAKLLGSSLGSLDRDSRAQIHPPWPRLVLGIGNRSVPAALAIRRLSGGTSKLVRLGNPRRDPSNFDLVITTSQYAVRDAPNVLRLPAAIGTAPFVEPTREEKDWLAKLPRPHRLLLIGGDTFMWTLPAATVAKAAKRLREKDGGSVIAVRSARTGGALQTAVAKALEGSEHGLVWGRFPRYAMLLHDPDEIIVSADSVAMLSDAISTGKPVGIIEPEMTPLGRFLYSLARIGPAVPVRDVRHFWQSARSAGLVGTVDEPRSGKLGDEALAVAIAAIRDVLKS